MPFPRLAAPVEDGLDDGTELGSNDELDEELDELELGIVMSSGVVEWGGV
jgi:hypothetical protein